MYEVETRKAGARKTKRTVIESSIPFFYDILLFPKRYLEQDVPCGNYSSDISNTYSCMVILSNDLYVLVSS
jgi:hypothetical protein